MNKKIIILKLGGSLITDKTKPFTPRLSIINNLAYQIKGALEADPSLQLIIGNGGGSFPHYPAVTYNMKEGIKNKRQLMGYAKVQDAASRLNRIIVEQLIGAGVAAVSVNPSSMIVCRDGKVKNIFIEPLTEMLSLGLTPVFYGDIVTDETLGSTILSTEKLIIELVQGLLLQGLTISKIIQNGSTKGLLDKEGGVIDKITPDNLPSIKNVIGETVGFDVTGGMLHKIEESLILAKKGINTQLINGSLDRKILQNAILDKPVIGTTISA